MLNLVFDTSALISLESATLTDKSTNVCRYFLPQLVYEEIRDLAKYTDVHGKAATRLLQKDSLTIKKAGEIHSHLPYVDKGEAAALTLANRISTDYLVCDDYESF